MAVTSSGRLLNTPRRKRFSEMSRKKRSTLFNHDVLKIDANPKLMSIGFRPNPPIDAMRIIELVQKNRSVKRVGNHKLRVEKAFADPKDRAQYMRDVLRALGPPTGPIR